MHIFEWGALDSPFAGEEYIMIKRKLSYFDHAATSWPKPRGVEEAMIACMHQSGGNPGRGAHQLSMGAAREVFGCREVAARLFGTSPERVIFTLNTTHALNIVIKGVMGRGGHVLCSDMEHNAVLRPLYRLQERGVCTFDTFETFPLAKQQSEERILASLASRVRPDTRMVVCAHASNICSAHLPIRKIGAFCRRRGLILVVDGAQSAGCMDIDMERDGIDALCVPGHKGLLGPQGTGMLLLGSRFGQTWQMDTLTEGGNGMDSLSPEMRGDVPEKFEAGTVATPAIAGLRAGMEYVLSVGPSVIGAKEAALAGHLRDALTKLPNVTVYAPQHEGSVVLFSVAGFSPEAVAEQLNAQDICVRPGFHCAALGHQTLGTYETGAVRASVGWSTRERDVEWMIEAVSWL